MIRTRPTLMFLGLVGALGLVGQVAASAASSVTVDELDPPGVVVTSSSVDNPSITFTGTVSSDELGGIVLFIDGTLVSCEDYFGNDVNEATCYRVASIDGGVWRFPLFQDEVERIGLDFLGVHDFRFARIDLIDGRSVIVAEATITAEVAEELPVADPEPVVEPSAPGTVPGEAPGDAGTHARSSSQLSTGDPAAPSVLSSVPSVGATIAEPPNLLVAAAVTIILLLLVGLPSSLLGATLSDNYDRIFGRASAAVRRATAPFTRALAASTVPGWLPLALGIVAASILSSFVDPGFGLNWGSARMLLSMALAFAIETLLGWVVIRAVLKRTDPGLDPKPQLKWGSLLIVLVAVILSRLVGFEPGMVFGLIVGLAFGVTLATAQDVRIKLIGIGWAIVIGLVGWVGYSVLSGIDGWLPVLLAETLSGIAVGSLAALPIALLPLRGLDGETLFSWNRWAWAGLYGFGLLLFFVVLMPMPFSWGEVGAPLVTWICLYLGYAALAVGVWAWFRFRPVRVATVGSADSAVGQT